MKVAPPVSVVVVVAVAVEVLIKLQTKVFFPYGSHLPVSLVLGNHYEISYHYEILQQVPS